MKLAVVLVHGIGNTRKDWADKISLNCWLRSYKASYHLKYWRSVPMLGRATSQDWLKASVGRGWLLRSLIIKKDIFNQCNFTIEISKNALEINAIIRNGRTTNKKTPLWVFFDKASKDASGFLKIMRDLKKEDRFIVYRDCPCRTAVIL